MLTEHVAFVLIYRGGRQWVPAAACRCRKNQRHQNCDGSPNVLWTRIGVIDAEDASVPLKVREKRNIQLSAE
jgi:hypothetical protein